MHVFLLIRMGSITLTLYYVRKTDLDKGGKPQTLKVKLFPSDTLHVFNPPHLPALAVCFHKFPQRAATFLLTGIACSCYCYCVLPLCLRLD